MTENIRAIAQEFLNGVNACVQALNEITFAMAGEPAPDMAALEREEQAEQQAQDTSSRQSPQVEKRSGPQEEASDTEPSYDAQPEPEDEPQAAAGQAVDAPSGAAAGLTSGEPTRTTPAAAEPGAANATPTTVPSTQSASSTSSTPRRPRQAIAALPAHLAWAPPNFRMLPLAQATSALAALRAHGQWADTEMLGDIGRRLMGTELNRLPEAGRQALLGSLQLHLRAATDNGCAVAFPTLLALQRAATASASPALAASLGTAVVDNLQIKRGTPQEFNGFNNFLLKGDAMELLQQLRSLPRPARNAMLTRLADFFEHARQTLTPGDFAEALMQRTGGNDTLAGRLQVSLSRLLSCVAGYAPFSASARRIAADVALLHGMPLPPELVAAADAAAWKQHAMKMFKGRGDGPPYDLHTGQGKLARRIDVNVHDAGVRILRWLMEEHLGAPANAPGVAGNRELRLQVGGLNHPALTRGLREEIANRVKAHPGWTAWLSGTVVTVTQREGPQSGVRL